MRRALEWLAAIGWIPIVVLGLAAGVDALTGSAPAPAAKASNDVMHVQQTVIACQAQDTLKRITGLSVDGDALAAQRLAARAIDSGDCTILRPGEPVFVEDVALLGPTRVRKAGEVVAWWTNGSVIE